MTNTTLKDSDKSSHESKGISVTISKGKEEQPMGTDNFNSLGIQYSDGGHEKQRDTNAITGHGNVTVGGQTVADSDTDASRDINKGQVMTKDRVDEGTNINLDLDIRYLTDTKAKLAEAAENLENLPGNLRTGLGAPHYVRNKYNQSDNAKKDKGGILLEKEESVFHGEGNTKYISPDGHNELVLDSQEKPITEQNDPEHMGTYNVFNPRGNVVEKIGHGIVDVVPYVFFGNAPTDPSTIGDRVGKSWTGIEKTLEKLSSKQQVQQVQND